MEVADKKVLVFGSGISGMGAAELLLHNGADVVLYDGNTEIDRAGVMSRFEDGSRIEIILGELTEKLMGELELVVLSPGVPTDLPVILSMREKGIRVIGEIELAYMFGKGDVLAITGTNGKTTTTALLGEIMKAAGKDVYVVGNIGNPYTKVAQKMTDQTVTVAEMSSFQLESIDTFRPKVSAILNITPDHLNRHHTMEAYIEAKKNIAKNQTASDYCILNYDDEVTRQFGSKVRAQTVYFSSRTALEKGIYLDGGNIIYRDGGETPVLNVGELKLLGTHNHENVMAAVAMAYVCGVPLNIIQKTVKAFRGVEHRIEYVSEKNGVMYYNDSKGTNPDAAIKGICAMNRPTVLIGGGYDKNSSYTEWIQSFGGRVKKLVLLGETKNKIAADANACGFDDYIFADTFEEAVNMAASFAVPGDAVLLSPACASWDMFPSYEVRGDKFKEIVNSL